MLCETILSYINMFPIRGNQFVCNNHKLGRDGGGLLLILEMNSTFRYVMIWLLVMIMRL